MESARSSETSVYIVIKPRQRRISEDRVPYGASSEPKTSGEKNPTTYNLLHCSLIA
jgi:hypothetical protein